MFQDEAILGFQSMFNDSWSWGVSGTYRKLHNAIDDMGITATPQCQDLIASGAICIVGKKIIGRAGR